VSFLHLQLVNCGLSPATVAKLEEKGITALFPIQKHVFEPVMAGRDLIGRARTGSGKTLAFALPVIENLVKVGFWFKRPPFWSYSPQCVRLLVLQQCHRGVVKVGHSARHGSESFASPRTARVGASSAALMASAALTMI